MAWFDSTRRKLATFASLSAGQRWLALAAVALAPVARLSLACLGYARTTAMLRALSKGADRRPRAAEESLALAREVARAVAAGTRNAPGGANCLRRSLMLWWLLRRRRVPATLHIGVRKPEGDFQAHAWVRVGDTVLNDSRDVAERYAPFAELRESAHEAAFPAEGLTRV